MVTVVRRGNTGHFPVPPDSSYSFQVVRASVKPDLQIVGKSYMLLVTNTSWNDILLHQLREPGPCHPDGLTKHTPTVRVLVLAIVSHGRSLFAEEGFNRMI